jgi:hypothetical protein
VILRKLESSDYSSSSLRRLSQRIFHRIQTEAVVVANSLLSIFLDSIKEKKSGSAKQQPRTKAKCRLLKGFKMIKKHARKERISLSLSLELFHNKTKNKALPLPLKLFAKELVSNLHALIALIHQTIRL